MRIPFQFANGSMLVFMKRFKRKAEGHVMKPSIRKLLQNDSTFYLTYGLALFSLLLILHGGDSFASQNLREAAQDLKTQIDSVAPILGGIGVGVGCLLMMIGLGGVGRMIAATGATGFVLFTLWPSLQSLIERIFHR